MREDKLKSFDDDIYNRKVIAENLTKIIEVQEEPMVISLDSEWGTGKTTFVTMWKDLLDNDEKYSSKFNTLYFNAWENDYITDPLLALVSEIEAEIKREDSKFKKNFNKVKQVILPMAKLVTKVGVKVGTAGVLDLDKVNLGDYTEDTIMDLASKLGEFSIKEIVASKSIRTKFKEVMSEYQKENGKKIIFFIDELDRCRPTFAIELLEVIKHLFNIDNCIFIISIDKEQLSHSVSTIYGQNMDIIGYLRRFFDLDYRLPKLDVHMYMDNNTSYKSPVGPYIAAFHLHHAKYFYTKRHPLRVYFDESGTKFWLLLYLFVLTGMQFTICLGASLNTGLVAFGIFSSLAELSHYWCHNATEKNRLIVWLQNHYILLSETHHKAHHCSDNIQYAFLNGFTDPLINRIAQSCYKGYKNHADKHTRAYMQQALK